MNGTNKVIIDTGIYKCPECGSKRITLHQQSVIQKQYNVNTMRLINPYTQKIYMSNRDKAHEYDRASGGGIGCAYYECRKCGWISGLEVE